MLARFIILAWLVVGSMFGASPATAADVLRFDLGTKDSPLRDGFTRVTAKTVYAPQAGFGWRNTAGLKEQYQAYSREWKRNEGRGRDEPPPIYANEVTCDAIVGREANAFLADVPPGEYRVWLLCGRSAGQLQDHHEFQVSAGGDRQKIIVPGPYIFEQRVLTARVASGPLAIEFSPTTAWLAAAIVIYPAQSEVEVGRSFLDALKMEIEFLPPDVAEKWVETKHVDSRPAPEYTAADRRRGYALFARHWSDVIYPNTVPRGSELNPQLQLFASWGEFEPVTFTVVPLKDLAGCRVTAGDLRCGDAVIPAVQIDVRYVRYMLARPNYSLYNSYHIVPDVLEHRDSVDLRAGVNQTVWATLHVPADAKAGLYTGHFTLHVPGGEAAEVPLTVRVLPIRLKTDPDKIFGIYYRDPLRYVDPRNPPALNAYLQRKAERERQDMVDHGLNNHISDVSGLSRDPQGNWTLDGAETERRIALDRKFGLASKPLVVSFPVEHVYRQMVDKQGTGSHLRLVREDVPEAFFAEITRMVATIQREKQKYDWPEFLYYPIDEPSTQTASVKFMVNVLRAIKAVPGARTYVTADPDISNYDPLWPYVDVWCCQPFVFDHAKIKALSAEKKIEFWCYPNHVAGENDHTPVRGARMSWGFGFWRSGFKALTPWIYQSNVGDPWNYLDGTSMDFLNRSTPEGDPIPVTQWEAYREGFDDGRYIYTLAQLIAAGRAAGGKAAAAAGEAQRDLDYVWNAIAVQEKYKHDNLWPAADFDAYRWLLARRILGLQELLSDAGGR